MLVGAAAPEIGVRVTLLAEMVELVYATVSNTVVR